jgi:hypothetical protein
MDDCPLDESDECVEFTITNRYINLHYDERVDVRLRIGAITECGQTGENEDDTNVFIAFNLNKYGDGCHVQLRKCLLKKNQEDNETTSREEKGFLKQLLNEERDQDQDDYLDYEDFSEPIETIFRFYSPDSNQLENIRKAIEDGMSFCKEVQNDENQLSEDTAEEAMEGNAEEEAAEEATEEAAAEDDK